MTRWGNSPLEYKDPKQNVFFMAEVTDNQPSPSASGEQDIGKGPYDPQAGPSVRTSPLRPAGPSTKLPWTG